MIMNYECTTAHYLIFADRHWDNLRLEEGCHLWHFDLWADGFISFPVKPLLKDWKHVDFDSHVEALDAICSVDLSKISPNLSFWATIIQNHYYKLIFLHFANTYMLCFLKTYKRSLTFVTNCGWKEITTVVETKIPFGFSDLVLWMLQVSKGSSIPATKYYSHAIRIYDAHFMLK